MPPSESGRHLKEKKSAQYRLIGMQAETQCSLDRKSNEEKLTNSGLDTIANQKLVFSERIFVEVLKLKLIQAIYLHGMK